MDDYSLPMPKGVIVCGGKPTNDDIAEIYQFQEYLREVESRGKDAVINDPKWRPYLGLPVSSGSGGQNDG